VAEILDQLGLDATFFIQIAIFFVLFAFLSRAYFAPFMKLFQERHERTVSDREAARAMITQADEKFAEYQQRLSEARLKARAEVEEAIRAGKAEEHAILSSAREEAKKITLAAVAEVEAERSRLRAAIDTDVESLAKSIVDQLLVRKGT